MEHFVQDDCARWLAKRTPVEAMYSSVGLVSRS